MKLASLPGGGAKYDSASGAKASMIVGDDEFDPSHPARYQAVEEAAPVDLSF